MKPDIYTKTVLAVIALLLAVIALRPFPETIAQAQTSFAGVQFSPISGPAGEFKILAFDTRTGEVWLYYSEVLKHGNMTAESLGNIGKRLGDPNSSLKSAY